MSVLPKKGSNTPTMMSYVSHEWTPRRSCPKVHPYQVWRGSEKNCTCESVDGIVSTDGLFSAANLTLAGFPRTNALGESMPSRHLNMFNLRLCNAAIIQHSQLKFGHMHLWGMDYKYFSPHCCKCNSFGCTATIRCDNACHGPHSDSLYSGSEHCQFNSPRLVKREAGFPNPRRALIGSNQLWRVNDSAYYREYDVSNASVTG